MWEEGGVEVATTDAEALRKCEYEDFPLVTAFLQVPFALPGSVACDKRSIYTVCHLKTVLPQMGERHMIILALLYTQKDIFIDREKVSGCFAKIADNVG